MKQVILVYRGRPVAFIIMDDDVEVRVVGGVGAGVEAGARREERRAETRVQPAASQQPARREPSEAAEKAAGVQETREERGEGGAGGEGEPELRFDEEVSEAESVTEAGGGESGGGERGAEEALRRLIQGV